MELAERIKDLRKKNGLSQGELAQKIGVSSAHLSRLENGRYLPSVEVLKNLADTLNVSTDSLIYGKEENLGEIKIQDVSLAERIRLLNHLDKKDRDIVVYIIDSFLAKKKILHLLTQESK